MPTSLLGTNPVEAAAADAARGRLAVPSLMFVHSPTGRPNEMDARQHPTAASTTARLWHVLGAVATQYPDHAAEIKKCLLELGLADPMTAGKRCVRLVFNANRTGSDKPYVDVCRSEAPTVRAVLFQTLESPGPRVYPATAGVAIVEAVYRHGARIRRNEARAMRFCAKSIGLALGVSKASLPVPFPQLWKQAGLGFDEMTDDQMTQSVLRSVGMTSNDVLKMLAEEGRGLTKQIVTVCSAKGFDIEAALRNAERTSRETFNAIERNTQGSQPTDRGRASYSTSMRALDYM